MSADASPFLSLLAICGFLACIWAAARVSKLIGISAMLLEIAMGVLLGPGVFHIISPQYEVCESERWMTCSIPTDWDLSKLSKNMKSAASNCDLEAYHEAQTSGDFSTHALKYANYEECLIRNCEKEVEAQCERTPDIFTLIGHGGVALMIFESGMHFDYDQFKVVGAKACTVATIGTILPLIAGTVCVWAFGRPAFPDGLAAGAALAPTSCGVALKLLQEAGALKERFGQAIMVAAFVDDVLSLIIFNVVFSLGDGGHFDYQKTVVFPILGIIFMAFASFLAVRAWPPLMNQVVLPRLASVKYDEDAKIPLADEVLFLTMMATLVGYASFTHFLGNHLWGCYFAGMSFACIKPEEYAHHVWQKQMKRVSTWMIRIFFSCTIAFSIPVQTLLSADAIWKGLIMGAGPCIATKVLSSIWVGEARFVIGWAMVGRAEFNFLIAQMAVTAGMLDEATFTIVIWSFLWATLLAPIVFQCLLTRYMARLHAGDNKECQIDLEDCLEKSKSGIEDGTSIGGEEDSKSGIDEGDMLDEGTCRI